MLNSVKSQIVLATSVIMVTILGATAYFVISQKVKEINHDIFTKAQSFAELTHERVIANYEGNFKAQAFAHFDREMAEIYGLNTDITGVDIFNYKGENLYHDEKAGTLEEMLSPETLERVQAVLPSVQTQKGRVLYLEKTDNGLRTVNFNGRETEPLKDSEQIENIIYPFRDQDNTTRSFSVRYAVSYAALAERVQKTVFDILILSVLGVVVALVIGEFVAGRITSPISKLTEGAEAIGRGNLKAHIDVKTESEIGKLAHTFNQMARDLQKSTEDLVAKEKMGRELELAGKIQNDLLPKKLPAVKNLDIAASLKSATEVGGDCYDFLKTSTDDLIFYIGDVTGHGVPAGIVSAINNALVPAFLEQYETTKELIEHLNRILRMKTEPNVFMTMVMAKWIEKASKLEFTQAGHEAILHYAAAKKEVAELATGGMALGMIDDLSKITKTETVAVAEGDVLVFYTDGIPEAWKNEKELYGMDRLKECIRKNATLSTAKEIHDALLGEVRQFMGTYPQQDDITLIVAKYKR